MRMNKIDKKINITETKMCRQLEYNNCSTRNIRTTTSTGCAQRGDTKKATQFRAHKANAILLLRFVVKCEPVLQIDCTIALIYKANKLSARI